MLLLYSDFSYCHANLFRATLLRSCFLAVCAYCLVDLPGVFLRLCSVGLHSQLCNVWKHSGDVIKVGMTESSCMFENTGELIAVLCRHVVKQLNISILAFTGHLVAFWPRSHFRKIEIRMSAGIFRAIISQGSCASGPGAFLAFSLHADWLMILRIHALACLPWCARSQATQNSHESSVTAEIGSLHAAVDLRISTACGWLQPPSNELRLRKEHAHESTSTVQGRNRYLCRNCFVWLYLSCSCCYFPRRGRGHTCAYVDDRLVLYAAR